MRVDEGNRQPSCSCRKEASEINTLTSLSSLLLSPDGAPLWTNPARSQRAREPGDVAVGDNLLDTEMGKGIPEAHVEEIQKSITITVAKHAKCLELWLEHQKYFQQLLVINY